MVASPSRYPLFRASGCLAHAMFQVVLEHVQTTCEAYVQSAKQEYGDCRVRPEQVLIFEGRVSP